ncbi:MAG: hypothetical protein ABH885_01720, partial [Candidatus Omnitrophota bacterium]
MEAFDSQKKSYEGNTTPLKDYIQFLSAVSRDNNIDTHAFKNLNRLVALMQREKTINFNRAQSQREVVLDDLAGKLSKVEIASLIDRTMEYKKGEISPSAYYEYLFRKMRSCGMDPAGYKDLAAYKTYLDEYDNVEKTVFFEELFDLERYIADSLSGTRDEEELYYLSDDMYVLDKLFSAALTRKQYDYLSGQSGRLSIKDYVNFIGEKAPWYNMPADINPDVMEIDAYKDEMTRFYTYSFERDEVFMENIEKYSAGNDAIFVVTGGFHTDSLTDLMKDRGYSYLVITPKLTQEKYNPYFKLLSGGLSPIETVFSEYTSLIAIRSAFSEMGVGADWEYMSEATDAMRALFEEVRDTGNESSAVIFAIPGGANRLKLTFIEEPGAINVGTAGERTLYVVPVPADKIVLPQSNTRVFSLREGPEGARVSEWVRQKGGAAVSAGAAGGAERTAGAGARPGAGTVDVTGVLTDKAYTAAENRALSAYNAVKRARVNVGIVIEIDRERMFGEGFGSTDLDAFIREVEQNIRQELNYQCVVGVKTVYGSTRDDRMPVMRAAVDTFIENNMIPVVFSLEGVRGDLDDLRAKLKTKWTQKVDIPCMTLTPMEATGKVLVNIGLIARMGILLEDLSFNILNNVSDRERMGQLVYGINAVKSVLQLGDEDPLVLNDLLKERNLWTGAISLMLPPLTRVTGDIQQIYRAMRKLEESL